MPGAWRKTSHSFLWSLLCQWRSRRLHLSAKRHIGRLDGFYRSIPSIYWKVSRVSRYYQNDWWFQVDELSLKSKRQQPLSPFWSSFCNPRVARCDAVSTARFFSLGLQVVLAKWCHASAPQICLQDTASLATGRIPDSLGTHKYRLDLSPSYLHDSAAPQDKSTYYDLVISVSISLFLSLSFSIYLCFYASMLLLCFCYASAMLLLCFCYASAMLLLWFCYGSAMFLLCFCYVSMFLCF